MQTITDLAELEAIYGEAVPASLTKVVDHVTPLYRQWIEASRFAVLSTVGPEGTDATPRGDDGPVVRIVGPREIWLPDWRGNNRIDALRNIVRDGRASLMFLVPGCNNVVRINGTAVVTTDPDVTGAFEQRGKHPRSVVVLSVGEVYFQCAKALMRSGLWQAGDESAAVPTAGDFVRAIHADFDGKAYDEGYAEYARPRMW
jgi:PPOX class probable FMN-dependent enzyme